MTMVEEGEMAHSHSTLSDDPVLPQWRLICIGFSLAFGLFISLLDTTIVATALYTIGADLKSFNQINWVALAYTLAYLGCAVIFARLADITGRRNAYIAAFLIFFAFSLGCGFAQTLNQLIVCRVLQGIGGSGLYSLTFVIFPEILPPSKVQMIGAMAGAVVAIAGILGPVLGGIITHYTTWRWIFWINAPMGIGPLILFIIAWPKPHQIRHIPLRSIRELDVIGALLIIAASVLVVFSFQGAGLQPDSWHTALFIAPLTIGCLCYIALFIWEILVSRFWEDSFATMFPLRLMKRRVYMGYVLTTLLGGFPYFLIIYTLPLRLQVVNDKSQLIAGVALLPMIGSVAVASTLAGIINTRKSYIFPTLLIGSLLMVIGAATLSTLDNVLEIEPKMYGFQVFMGLGFGLTVSTVSLGGALECELRDNTVAQGIIAQVRVLGGSIGIAAATAIQSVTQRRDLSGIITEQQLASLQDSAKNMTPEQLFAVRKAYSDSFSLSLKVCAALAGAGALATFMTWQRRPVDFHIRREEQAREERERLEKEGLTRARIDADEVSEKGKVAS
ncbi:MFS multidrug transporter-like protein [Venustampulla echinocandica]|uniref:MFS multidrug transporter-like protein n=1 Tax=Venustampulla echinocandica TaxID=2656787 RepID=A0A370TZW9_9HELO|nr:MFS multidrug transporter-like protein [Venustampulla echinocandica]RDL41063.1 MFS multidrug transporter-like protein [Venustampulla echinocandica]